MNGHDRLHDVVRRIGIRRIDTNPPSPQPTDLRISDPQLSTHCTRLGQRCQGVDICPCVVYNRIKSYHSAMGYGGETASDGGRAPKGQAGRGLIALVKLSGSRTSCLGTPGKSAGYSVSVGTEGARPKTTGREESLRLVDRGHTASTVCVSLFWFS